MTPLEWIGAAIRLLPIILNLISQFKASADAKVQRGLGRAEAEKEAYAEMEQRVQTAREVEVQAEKDHANIKDDGAFDREFERK